MIDPESIPMLLNNGSEMEDFEPYMYQNPRILEILLSNGYDIDECPNFDPVYAENIPELLRLGMDMYVHFTEYIWTHPRILEILLEHGFDINKTDHFKGMSMFGSYEYVQKYIQLGQDVNNGKYLIDAIRCNDDPNVIYLLLENGIDVNETDKFGFTALHYAIAREWYGVAKELHKRGVRLHMVSRLPLRARRRNIVHSKYVEVNRWKQRFGVAQNVKEYYPYWHFDNEVLSEFRYVPVYVRHLCERWD